MTEYKISANVFSRYDMYKFFLQECPRYDENGNKICTFEEYYVLEEYFSKLYSCDCTDCGGKDISRKCAVEEAFSENFDIIKNEDIV